MKKASISLSINFIVVLIISLVVMSLGFGLLKKMISKGNEGIANSAEQLQKEVEKILTSQNSPLYIAPRQVEVTAGDPALFVLGIRNLKSTGWDFAYGIRHARALDEDGNLMVSFPSWFSNDEGILAQNITKDPHAPGSGFFSLKSRDITKKTIVIKIPKNAPPGTYIYDVTVTSKNGASWDLYDMGKLYIIVH